MPKQKEDYSDKNPKWKGVQQCDHPNNMKETK